MRRSVLLSTAPTLVALALLAGCGGNPLVHSVQRQRRIIFSSSRALDGSDAVGTNATQNIWVIGVDGTGATPLTKLTAAMADSKVPILSPDGTKIAFLSMRALDGSDAPVLNQPPDCVYPRICPPVLTVFNLWVMDVDGKNAKPLTKFASISFFIGAPIWSPDSTRLAFESNQAFDSSDSFRNPGNIWLIDADGTGATPLTKLTADRADSVAQMWSPDGKKIVFYSNRALDGSDAANWPSNGCCMDPTSNIWVMNADGSGARYLTGLTADEASSRFPVWSPDGTMIAFNSYRALDGSNAAENYYTDNIWVMNADGSAATPLTKLTTASVSSSGPVFSPDGTRIAFESTSALDGSDAVNTNFTSNIWVINADGSGAMPLTQLTADQAWSGRPGWSPDGTKIMFSSYRALDGSNAARNRTNSKMSGS